MSTWRVNNHMLEVQGHKVMTLPVALINMKKVPDEHLDELLQELIREEEFEKCAQARDEINARYERRRIS